MADRRIAIVNRDRCKPKECSQECKTSCPVVQTGRNCVDVNPCSKTSFISEKLCIGCGICAKKCPFGAIQIVSKLHKELDEDTIHRYGPNAFQFHRLPNPMRGELLGLIGTRSIGKSTALRILAGKIKPNLGRFNNPPDWPEIVTRFQGLPLENYFTEIAQSNLKAAISTQYLGAIKHSIKDRYKTVRSKLRECNERGAMDKMCDDLELNGVLETRLCDLPGSELQRFAIAVVALQKADVYLFDEPTSLLDVKWKFKAAQVIRSLLKLRSYVIVVENDLSVIDYMADTICCLYGKPGAYGVASPDFSVRAGIRIFMHGFDKPENLCIRDESLKFERPRKIEDYFARSQYPEMSKTVRNFKLEVTGGELVNSQIYLVLGEKGTGKTIFLRMLAGKLQPDEVDGSQVERPMLNVSYKGQRIDWTGGDATVRSLLGMKIYSDPRFVSDVMKPLQIEQLLDQKVSSLSPGELEMVAIFMCLLKTAGIYLIDQQSAYLDADQRMNVAKAIKAHVKRWRSSAVIVEHDLMMATYLADQVILIEGDPRTKCTANAPVLLSRGMNRFLPHLDITFRRDPVYFIPRVNKLGSVEDREQKRSKSYWRELLA